MDKNIEEYFDELNRRLDDMSDEEIMELLIRSGLNDCPLLKENEK